MTAIATCSVRCGGKCCEDFPLSHSPERVAELYAAARALMEAGEAYDEDVVTIAEMVIRIDEDDEARPRYTCKHLDRAAGLCTIYERRPKMCSDFPGYGRGGACHICGFRNPKELPQLDINQGVTS